MSSFPRRPPVIFLMGPTASGKTALAVELVRRLPCDIVSVDSAMVYRDMDIGTAKPGPEILREAPHRLIDLLDPAESYSAGRFCTDARREIAAIRAAGRIPLLVGGTMLYFHALQRGIAVLPGADAAVRARIEAQARACGWAALHRRLAEVDPAAARRIHPNDPQRIQRALEVHALTGVSLTELQGRPNAPILGVPVVKLALAPGERAVLHRDIERRFRGMLQAGLTDEVRRLRRRGDLDLGRPALRAVGYRQVWEYLEGRIDHEAMVARAVIATRQIAKRQLTWLRAQTDALRLDSSAPDLLSNVLKALSKKKYSGVAPGSGMLRFSSQVRRP